MLKMGEGNWALRIYKFLNINYLAVKLLNEYLIIPLNKLLRPLGLALLLSSCVLYSSLFCDSSLAASGTGDRIPGPRFNSARCAALGQSCMPSVDEPSESLMVNPAGVAKQRGVHFEPLLLQTQANKTLVRDFPTDAAKIYNLNSMSPALQDKPGLAPMGGFSIFPNFGFRGFAAGVLYQRKIAPVYRNSVLYGDSVSQFTPSVGIGFRLASGVLRFGYVLQWVNQASGRISFNTTDTNISYGRQLPQGSGLSHNAGFALTLPYIYLPSLTLVARNIGGLRYNMPSMIHFSQDPSGRPATEKASYDVGIGWLYKGPFGSKFNFQGVFRDASNTADATALKRAAFGIELDILSTVKLRGGFGSGYPSAGLGFELLKSRVDISWFSDDVGTRATPVRDQKYMFQYSFKLF